MYIYVCILMHACTYICMHVYMHEHARARTHTHMPPDGRESGGHHPRLKTDYAGTCISDRCDLKHPPPPLHAPQPLTAVPLQRVWVG